MASNNLRILYNNVLDVSGVTLTTSSTASSSTTAANLMVDAKSLVWRSCTFSTTAVAANLIVGNFTSQVIGGVILPFTNLSTAATIRIKGYTGTTPTHTGTTLSPTISTAGASLQFTVNATLCCPYDILGIWNQTTLPTGVNTYYFGGGTYARIWVPAASQIACTSLTIEIVDTNTDKYIEASRLTLGNYWSPTYNTPFGLSATMKDLSTHNRSEAGDLVTNRGPRFNSINFNLDWLTPTDRYEMSRILKGNGIGKPMLISLFPDNSDDWTKEMAHQVYGKLSTLGSITHPIFDMYSTQIEIEEV